MAGSPKKRAKREAAAAAGQIPPEEIRSNVPALIPPPPKPRDRFGRETKFKPEYVDQARKLCEEGATNPELAAFFEVSESTFHLWRHVHPEFNRAIVAGRGPADDRVERSIYELSTGYTYEVEEPIKLRDARGNERIEYVTKVVHVPPNPQAAQFWLKNRRPDAWKDRTEKHVTGGIEVEHLTADQARERLKAKLLQLGNQAAGGE